MGPYLAACPYEVLPTAAALCCDMPCFAITCHALLKLCFAGSACHACVMLCYATSHYAMLHNSMLSHSILCYPEPFVTQCHTTTPTLQDTTLYEFMPFCAMLPHAMLCHAMLCYVRPCCPVTMCHVVFCYAVLCCAVLCCVMLCHGVCRVPWGEALLSLDPTREKHDPTNGQVLTRGLSARVGIFHGPITRLCPHAVTGELLPIPKCC